MSAVSDVHSTIPATFGGLAERFDATKFVGEHPEITKWRYHITLQTFQIDNKKKNDRLQYFNPSLSADPILTPEEKATAAYDHLINIAAYFFDRKVYGRRLTNNTWNREHLFNKQNSTSSSPSSPPSSPVVGGLITPPPPRFVTTPPTGVMHVPERNYDNHYFSGYLTATNESRYWDFFQIQMLYFIQLSPCKLRAMTLVDTNRDGQLSEGELSAYLGRPVDQLIPTGSEGFPAEIYRHYYDPIGTTTSNTSNATTTINTTDATNNSSSNSSTNSSGGNGSSPTEMDNEQQQQQANPPPPPPPPAPPKYVPTFPFDFTDFAFLEYNVADKIFSKADDFPKADGLLERFEMHAVLAQVTNAAFYHRRLEFPSSPPSQPEDGIPHSQEVPSEAGGDEDVNAAATTDAPDIYFMNRATLPPFVPKKLVRLDLLPAFVIPVGVDDEDGAPPNQHGPGRAGPLLDVGGSSSSSQDQEQQQQQQEQTYYYGDWDSVGVTSSEALASLNTDPYTNSFPHHLAVLQFFSLKTFSETVAKLSKEGKLSKASSDKGRRRQQQQRQRRRKQIEEENGEDIDEIDASFLGAEEENTWNDLTHVSLNLDDAAIMDVLRSVDIEYTTRVQQQQNSDSGRTSASVNVGGLEAMQVGVAMFVDHLYHHPRFQFPCMFSDSYRQVMSGDHDMSVEQQRTGPSLPCFHDMWAYVNSAGTWNQTTTNNAAAAEQTTTRRDKETWVIETVTANLREVVERGGKRGLIDLLSKTNTKFFEDLNGGAGASDNTTGPNSSGNNNGTAGGGQDGNGVSGTSKSKDPNSGSDKKKKGTCLPGLNGWPFVSSSSSSASSSSSKTNNTSSSSEDGGGATEEADGEGGDGDEDAAEMGLPCWSRGVLVGAVAFVLCLLISTLLICLVRWHRENRKKTQVRRQWMVLYNDRNRRSSHTSGGGAGQSRSNQQSTSISQQLQLQSQSPPTSLGATAGTSHNTDNTNNNNHLLLIQSLHVNSVSVVSPLNPLNGDTAGAGGEEGEEEEGVVPPKGLATAATETFSDHRTIEKERTENHDQSPPTKITQHSLNAHHAHPTYSTHTHTSHSSNGSYGSSKKGSNATKVAPSSPTSLSSSTHSGHSSPHVVEGGSQSTVIRVRSNETKIEIEKGNVKQQTTSSTTTSEQQHQQHEKGSKSSGVDEAEEQELGATLVSRSVDESTPTRLGHRKPSVTRLFLINKGGDGGLVEVNTTTTPNTTANTTAAQQQQQQQNQNAVPNYSNNNQQHTTTQPAAVTETTVIHVASAPTTTAPMTTATTAAAATAPVPSLASVASASVPVLPAATPLSSRLGSGGGFGGGGGGDHQYFRSSASSTPAAAASVASGGGGSSSASGSSHTNGTRSPATAVSTATTTPGLKSYAKNTTTTTTHTTNHQNNRSSNSNSNNNSNYNNHHHHHHTTNNTSSSSSSNSNIHNSSNNHSNSRSNRVVGESTPPSLVAPGGGGGGTTGGTTTMSSGSPHHGMSTSYPSINANDFVSISSRGGGAHPLHQYYNNNGGGGGGGERGGAGAGAPTTTTTNSIMHNVQNVLVQEPEDATTTTSSSVAGMAASSEVSSQI